MRRPALIAAGLTAAVFASVALAQTPAQARQAVGAYLAGAGAFASYPGLSYDVAVDLAAREGERVNLGGSPGDGYIAESYVYVAPFGSARPGDAAFWNAPFGAARTATELGDGDPVTAATTFLLDGVRRLATGKNS